MITHFHNHLSVCHSFTIIIYFFFLTICPLSITIQHYHYLPCVVAASLFPLWLIMPCMILLFLLSTIILLFVHLIIIIMAGTIY